MKHIHTLRKTKRSHSLLNLVLHTNEALRFGECSANVQIYGFSCLRNLHQKG